MGRRGGGLSSGAESGDEAEGETAKKAAEERRENHNAKLSARRHAAANVLPEPVRVSTRIIAAMFIKFQTMPLRNAVW